MSRRARLLDHPRYFGFLADTHPQLCICDGRGQSARLPVPSFLAPLDVREPLLPGVWKRLLDMVARVAPERVHPPSLFIGTPFERYDQSRLLESVQDPSELCAEALEVARAGELDLVVLTNVSPDHPRLEAWLAEGFKALPSFPDTVVDLSAPSFDEHLALLPPGNRSGIRRNIRRFEEAGHSLERLECSRKEGPALFRSYWPFFDKATVQWYPHTEEYFSRLADLGDDVHLTAARCPKGESIGFIVNFRDGDGFQSGRIGVRSDYHREDAVYFRLMYHAIEEALVEGTGMLSFEPTGYRMKRHLGATAEPLVNLCLGVSPTWRALLGSLSGLGQRVLAHLVDPPLLEEVY